MTDASRWEELHARTGDNLAAAREILKDAGTVTRWSRQIAADMQGQRDARRSEKNARRSEKEARQQDQQKVQQESPAPGTESDQSFSEPATSEPMIVVRLDGNFDLLHSPSVLDLFHLLAADLAASPLESASPPDGKPQELEGGEQRLDTRGQRLVVDLRGVKRIDASGVSCLISCRRVLAKNSHRLVVLLEPGSQPKAVFDKENLGRIITDHSSMDDL